MTREVGLKLCIHGRREELFDFDQYKCKVHKADRTICKTKLIRVNSLFWLKHGWNYAFTREIERGIVQLRPWKSWPHNMQKQVDKSEELMLKKLSDWNMAGWRIRSQSTVYWPNPSSCDGSSVKSSSIRSLACRRKMEIRRRMHSDDAKTEWLKHGWMKDEIPEHSLLTRSFFFFWYFIQIVIH